MKYSAPFQPATLLASLALVTPSPAQDAPAPEAAVEIQAAAEAIPAPAAKADVKPYLGLGASAVPGFLGKHLNLPADSGVMVRSMDPEGPAAKAGFTVDDVITKINGKAVASHREMVDSFLTKKPGETIEIEFIHEGKPGTRSIALGERSVAQAAIPAPAPGEAKIKVLEGQLPQLNGIGGNLPPDIEKRVRDAMENALKNGGANQMRIQILPGGNGGVQIVPGANGANGPQNGLKFGVASSVNMMDDQGAVELKTADGGSEVRVTDKAGKEVWSGPWDTDQDKAAAPPDVRKRIERLNIMQPIPGKLQAQRKLQVIPPPAQDEAPENEPEAP